MDMKESLLSHDEDELTASDRSPSRKHQKYLNSLPTIDGSNALSTLFFGWMYSFISFGSNNSIKVDSMPSLPTSMQSKAEFELMRESFEQTAKNKRKGFTLMKVLAKTYWCEFMKILTFVTIYVSIQSLSPYLTALVMRYISDRDSYESYYGGLLFGIIVIVQTLKSLSEAHLNYRFAKLGINMTNSLTLLIFTKSLKYQSIAEK